MESKRIELDKIKDGALVAVIVHEGEGSGGYRVIGYCDGRDLPDNAVDAATGGEVFAPCVCGAIDFRYMGHSHKLPDVHPWPTLTYRCGNCDRLVSFHRLSAAEARRAMLGGLGIQRDD